MLRRYRPDPEIDRLCAGSANCELVRNGEFLDNEG